MMKVIIKSLKASWPEGAQLGSVVLIDSDVLPDSLAGKCSPAPDDAEAMGEYVAPPLPDPRNPGESLVPLHTMPSATLEAFDPDALAAAQALLAEARTEADELRAMVVDLQGRLAAAEQAAAAKGKKG